MQLLKNLANLKRFQSGSADWTDQRSTISGKLIFQVFLMIN